MTLTRSLRQGLCWAVPVGLLVAAGVVAQAKTISQQFNVSGTLEAPPVMTQLIAEHTAVQPGGQTRVGVLIEIPEGWHIYADPPGDSGLPTSVEWSAPPEATLGSLQWPPHEEFLDPGDIRTYGYKDRVLLTSTLSLAADAPTQGALPITADVEWLACKEICIPGSAQLTLDLPVQSNPPVLSPQHDLFAEIDTSNP